MDTLLQPTATRDAVSGTPFETPRLLALDLGGTHVRIGLAQGGRFTDQATLPWPANQTAEEDVAWLVERVHAMLARHEAIGSVRAAGVSLAANLDGNGRVALWPNRRSWDGLPIQACLQEQLGFPVVIEDDANAAALAESCACAENHDRHVMVVTVGTGIGAGIVLDGSLYHGAHRWAGELGHITVQPEGPICRCGKRGCLQVVASGQTLDRIAREQGLASGRELSQAAERGDAWARQALESSAHWLGVALANVVTLLDLDAIILGGSVLDWPSCYWHALETTFHEHNRQAASRTVPLRRAVLAESAGLHGALRLAMSATIPQVAGSRSRRATTPGPANRVAASLALPDTDATLDALALLGDSIGLAEICLDSMTTFDLKRLLRDAPCPLIITYRPVREGGSFAGPESERLEVLAEAMRRNCAYIDVEWDAIDALPTLPGSTTQRIVSKHWFDGMPEDLWWEYEQLRDKADVVKLAVTANHTKDALQVLDFLATAPTPVIGMAMGEAGRITRLLAPCFPNSVLTFGSLDDRHATAPGQLSVQTMVRRYGLDQAGSETHVTLHCQTENSDAVPLPHSAANGENRIHLPWAVTARDMPSIRAWVRSIPNLDLA